MATRNRAILDLPMTAQCHQPTEGRTLDVSPNSLHATFGAGAATPTKIAGQRGYTFDGGDWMYGPCNGLFNTSAITIALLFYPGRDGTVAEIYSDTDTRHYIYVQGATLRVYFSNTIIFSVPNATWLPYYHRYGANTLIATGQNNDEQLFLNNVSIGTSAAAWAASNPTVYSVGSNFVGGAGCLVTISQVEVYPFRMTAIQAADWHQRALRHVNMV